jgi:hypothetical protein
MTVEQLEDAKNVIEGDMRRLFDAAGNLKPIEQVREDPAVASVEVVERVSEDGQVETVVKIEMKDKMSALEAAAKHFGLF